MKKYIVFKSISLCLFLVSMAGYSQIRIGNTTALPDGSALLDVNATNKGLLLPRVALGSTDDVATIPNPANGLLVYNTTAAGTGITSVKPNLIYTWKLNKWESVIDLVTIKTLKVPIDYVLLSKATQIYSASQLTTVNTPSNTIPVTWSSTEIVLDNPNDMALNNATDILVKTASFYQVTGSFTFAINTASAGAASYVVVTLQSSTDNGGTWTDRSAAAMSYEKDNISTADQTTDFPKPQTIVMPNFVHKFAANELIRFVISKPSATATNYSTGTGIQSRLTTDNTKTVRFTRLTE
ncbi:MAG: hypothetical protein QOA57_02710 [Nitrososphaeraceae archaeon]|nr:hypothetical protein [Nitrososphaeraceae archaeon]